MNEKLLTDEELAVELGTGFKPRTIKTLRLAKKIPYDRIGHRTIRYRLTRVLAALARLEEGAVTTKRRNGAR